MTSPAIFRRYFSDRRGNVTMIFGLAAIPLVAAAGLAIDMARIEEAQSKMQSVADGAAMAAAAAKGTDAQRKLVGQAYVTKNIGVLHGVSAVPTVTIMNTTATVAIATEVEGTLLKLAFLNHTDGKLPTVNFTVSAGAEVKNGEGYYRCLIALNQSMADAIYIRGTGDFLADKCGVHADSSQASSALHFQGNASATAKAFTVVGGFTKTGGAGYYSPSPVTKQTVAGDPYKLGVNTPSGTATSITIKKQNGNVSLNQIKYGNITIQAQGTATFTPGVHYITGTLSLGSQAVLNATGGVTLVLSGNSAVIDMSSGATMKLYAPTGGAYPGFAVVQDPLSSPTGVNTVQGGAGSNIRGIWYTPKQKLYITGNGDFNASSNYSPMIVDNIEIGGNGTFTLRNDWAAYGYEEPKKLYYSAARTARLVN